MIKSAWVSVEEQISTASISESLRILSVSFVTTGILSPLAKASVSAFIYGSAMALISSSGTNMVMFFA